MGGSVAEPRPPETQKCMKYRELTFHIKRIMGANTDDQDKNVQEMS